MTPIAPYIRQVHSIYPFYLISFCHADHFQKEALQTSLLSLIPPSSREPANKYNFSLIQPPINTQTPLPTSTSMDIEDHQLRGCL